MPPPRDFLEAMESRVKAKQAAIIAEIKKICSQVPYLGMLEEKFTKIHEAHKGHPGKYQMKMEHVEE